MKVESYSKELTEQLVAAYNEAPSRETVDALALTSGKSVRSIIAKLSSMGVYKAAVRTTKTGDPVVKKEELVADIETWLEAEFPTLAKTGKQELIKLHSILEKVMGELRDKYVQD